MGSRVIVANALSDALRREQRPFGAQVSTLVPGNTKTRFGKNLATITSQVRQAQPPEDSERYGKSFNPMRQRFAEMVSRAIAPELVARTIARALTDWRAKPYYRVGRNMQLINLVTALTSRSIQARLLARLYAIPQA